MQKKMYEEQIAAEGGKVEIEPNQDVRAVKLLEYEPKFLRVEGYCLPEDSTIHCANGEKMRGQSGEFYVLVDKIFEFIVPAKIFRKLFIRKME